MRAARRLAAPVAGLAIGALSACTSPDAPWDVPPGWEPGFERVVAECDMLTRDASGNEGPIAFDTCMERRGWRRQGPLVRWWRGLRAPEDAAIDGAGSPR